MDKATLISLTKKIFWIPFAGIFIFWIVPGPTYITTTELSGAELSKIYAENYLASKIDSFNWKGSLKNCDMGSIPADVYAKAEKRINFYRLGNRLPAIMVVDDMKKEAQAAALITYANNSGNHYPPKTAKCYSEEGKNGCAASCLGFSDFKYFPQTAFLDDFMYDGGEGNYFVGHRRWILYSKVKKFSFGATSKTEALCYINDLTGDTSKLEFAAYPWNGCFPVNLISPKWSFHIAEKHKVSFDKAVIKITDEKNKALAFKKYPVMKGFPDNVLSWKMTSLFTADEDLYQKNTLEAKGFVGKVITITIENVSVDGKVKNYKYNIRVMKM